MARLRTSPTVSSTGGVPVELTDPLHPVWSIPRTADQWRAVHGLRPADSLVYVFKAPATGCRLRHAQALADWSDAHNLDPRQAVELTGWTTRPTAMERAAARSGTDYVQDARTS